MFSMRFTREVYRSLRAASSGQGLVRQRIATCISARESSIRCFSLCNILCKKSKSKGVSKDQTPIRGEVEPVKETDFVKLEQDYQSVVTNCVTRTSQLISGRTAPTILSNLVLEDGVMLGREAAVTLRSPKVFQVTCFDPDRVKDISKAILTSGKSFNPQPDPKNPTILTVNIPPESALDRGKKVQELGVSVEAGKMRLKHLRGDAIRGLKSQALSRDEDTRVSKKVHDLYAVSLKKLVEEHEKGKAALSSKK